jgi:hypothetical protein
VRPWPLLLLAAAGCAGPAAPSSAPLAPTPVKIGVSIAISPDPVIATDSANPDAPLAARWTVQIASAAVGAHVNFVNATLRDGASGAEAEPSGTLSLGSADILAETGTDHVDPTHSLAVVQSLEYALPSGGRVGVLTVTVQLTADDGTLLSKSVQVPVS